MFPDGELLDVAQVALAMGSAGYEVRDVESLREHYALTLRCWVAQPRGGMGPRRGAAGRAPARIWRLYMAASAIGFEDGGISIHQVLGVVPDETGTSGMPLTRDAWHAAT